MNLTRRRRLFVDFKLQGVLLAHTAIYWCYCLLSVTLTATCWVVFAHRPGSSAELFSTLWGYFGPALIGSILLLPLVLMDCLRLSNRFAGPMVRLRVAMHRLANGEPVKPVKLRDGDFWCEFAADFNRVLARDRQPRADAAAHPAEDDARSCWCLGTLFGPEQRPASSDHPDGRFSSVGLTRGPFRPICFNGIARMPELRQSSPIRANRP